LRGQAPSVAREIEQALSRSGTVESFVHELLAETLEWPIPGGSDRLEDLTYDWTSADLRAAGLDAALVAGKAHQLVLPGNPWGIFILEFQNEEALMSGRGMTGLLRQVLEGLVVRRRTRDPHLAAFRREHLLFICTFRYERFRFVYFKAPTTGVRTSPMASFGWGPDDLGALRTICEFNLAALKWPTPVPRLTEEWISAWSSAFDVERVTQRFYDDYAVIFHSAEVALRPTTSLGEADLRLFTQSLFNRLMFLRFLERKGWLVFPGQRETRYLEALVASDAASGASVFRSRVRPLFFEGLASDRGSEDGPYGRVPRLNGGLFEASALDDLVADVPDEVIRSVVGTDGLFYRYNFTVEESTPLNIEVAVDPEMLGHVFEELVTGRHGSGSYYTPRPIVSYMCRQVLKHYLEIGNDGAIQAIGRLVGSSDASGLTDEHALQLGSRLEAIKVVDPACGSGAYLLGMLHELIAIRTALIRRHTSGEDVSLFDLKLQIISSNLYGVDIDPFATEIAKLRLWLSLAIESDEPIPLPNLDYKIETGDSLGPFDRLAGLFDVAIREHALRLQDLKDEFLRAHGSAKESLRETIAREQAAISTSLRHIVAEGVIDWPVQFADVFERRGGFDVVLANPPYVSAIEHGRQRGPVERDAVRRRFQSTTGAWDLYVPFFERGVEILNEGGLLAYVSPNKYLSATYATALRAYVRSQTTMLQIVDLSQVPVFRSASVYPVLTFLARGRSDAVDLSSRQPQTEGIGPVIDPETFRTVQMPQGTLDLLPDLLWGFLLSDRLDLLTKLLPMTSPMPHFAEAFATTTAAEASTYGRRITEHDGGAGFKVVNTGTIDPFRSLWGSRQLTDGGARYLKPVIRPQVVSQRRRDMYRSPKILVSKIASRCEAFLDSEGQYAGMNVNCLIHPRPGASLEFLCAYLNSRVFMFFYDQLFGALRMSGGYYQFQSPQLRRMPVPIPTPEARDRIGTLAMDASVAAENGADDEFSETIQRLDAAIGELVGLSADEVAAL
jgi:hypothetical protein